MIKLTALEQRVFDALYNRRGQDVEIAVIYAASHGLNGAEPTVRTMQQKLGTTISRINKKLKKGKIAPGRLKQTYRLTIAKPANP